MPGSLLVVSDDAASSGKYPERPVQTSRFQTDGIFTDISRSAMPQSIRIGAFLLAFSIVSVSAAPIDWQPAEDTTDPTVILTSGVLVEAVNASAISGVVSVNGVDFSPDDALLPFNAFNAGLSGQGTLDPGLDELLNSVDYGGGTSVSLSVGAGALVSGQSYSIQVFYTDLRGTARVMTYGDGLGNTVDVNSQGGVGAFGQFAIGTFEADAPSQTLSLAINSGNVHINGYQICTAVSPPVIASFTESSALISSGESTTLHWQVSGADSAGITPSVGSVNAAMGNATVSPTTTTTYTLTANNAGGSVTSMVTIGVDEPFMEPIISEFLASNQSGSTDETGASSDWIEIHNRNSFAIDLAGYHLTDDASNPNQWSFPADTRLAGNSYLVVFASGTSSLTGPFHTNFKLSAKSDYLALVAPDGISVVDQFNPYPAQRPNFSYGVAGGGGGGYFKPPTPGMANGPAFNGFVTDTSFDIDRGFFDTQFTVEIATPTLGATIVYTTDGTEPTLSNGTATPPVDGGTPGAASVSISGTTVLRAAAFKIDLSPTDIDTQTYLFTADIVEQPEMDSDVVDAPAYSAEIGSALKSVRSLSIVTAPDNLFDSTIGILENTGGRGIEWERPVSIEFIDPDFPGNSFQTDAGLRMHGNGSRGSAKNSLRLLFRAEYGAKKLEYPVFGENWVAQEFNTVVLRAQGSTSWTTGRSLDRTSATYLQDSFAKDTQGAMGQPTAGSTFVHLFLNGTYWGLYNPTERPDGSFGEDHFGGDDTDYDAVSRRFNVEVQSGTKVHWDAMIAHSNTLLDTTEEYEQLEDFIDVDNLIDYMLVHQFMQSRDGPDDFGHNNMRLVRRNNPPGRWQAYLWDMEYSMLDTMGTRDYDYPFPIYSSTRANNIDISDSIASIYLRLKDNNPEFQLRYADRAYKHLYNGGALSEPVAAARFEQRAKEIESAVIGESARWGDHRRAVPYTRDVEWTTERNRLLTEFFPARPDHVISQLRIHGLYPSIDPPVFNQHGGHVTDGFEITITAASDTVYYTTDGSDPRQQGGAISISAMSYESEITISDVHTHVMARSFVASTGEWSALSEADFNILIDPVLVNEVLTHTDLPEIDSIELHNPGSNNADIGGWFLTDDVSVPQKFRIPDGTTIPAGGYLVFDESDFTVGPNAFRFSEYGEQACLFSAEANGDLTGYSHGWDFKAAPNGVTTGLHIDSQGREHFVLQAANTLGSENSTPLVGPVIVSEINYRPPNLSGGVDNNADEFIELTNTSSSAVPLYSTYTSVPGYGHDALEDTWQLRNAVDFDFPSGVELKPGERVLVVGFDPGDASHLASLRSNYNIPAGVKVYGPWTGELNNSGEEIELRYPGAADADASFFVPYYTAEEIDYKDSIPWPAEADGLGSSLQRISFSQFANDPQNWKAETPQADARRDADDDDMEDWWEILHGLTIGIDDSGLDLDQDGFTNLQEFLARTSPSDSDSFLHLTIESSETSLALSFTAAQDVDYTILYTDSLVQPDWQIFHEVAADPQERDLQFEFEPTETRRFFRVITSPVN